MPQSCSRKGERRRREEEEDDHQKHRNALRALKNYEKPKIANCHSEKCVQSHWCPAVLKERNFCGIIKGKKICMMIIFAKRLDGLLLKDCKKIVGHGETWHGS